jgi:dihydrofolate reductase
VSRLRLRISISLDGFVAGPRQSESSRVVEESLTIMGRNMFGGHPGPWDAGNPWSGWRGANPPFHHPVFVLTHHAREPLALEGGTTFTFVTGGIKPALEKVGDDLHGLKLARTVAAADVTHLKFSR